MILFEGSPALYPACCMVNGRGGYGRYVDIEAEVVFDGRGYVCEEIVAEMAALMGFVSPVVLNGALERIEALEAELAEHEAEMEDKKQLEEAIAFTLQRGVVVDRRSGKIKLRGRPGQVAPSLNAVVVEDAVIDMEFDDDGDAAILDKYSAVGSVVSGSMPVVYMLCIIYLNIKLCE